MTRKPIADRSAIKTGRRHKKPHVIYPFEEADNRLFDLFRHHGFGEFPHAERRRLVEFYLLLMNHQLSDNVTRLVKFRDIGIKHFIDSLMVPRLTTLSFPLLDIGTGAGFPGIPLKIAFPQEKIVLAETVRRRVDFLKEVRDTMKLEELQIVGRKIDNSFLLPMKGVITRALEDMSATVANVAQSLEVGGKIFFMKGPHVDEELNRLKQKCSGQYRVIEDHHYSLPNTPHERRLIVLQRESN